MRILRYFLLAVALAAAIYAGWWLFGRSPEQQVLARQSILIEAVEDRDWEDVKALLAPDFTTSVGHNRDNAVSDLEQVLGLFLVLTLKTQLIDTQATADQATVQMHIRLEGTGSGLSQVVLARANQMKAPWTFQWQKKGPWPWNWQLTQIHHPDLQPAIPQ